MSKIFKRFTNESPSRYVVAFYDSFQWRQYGTESYSSIEQCKYIASLMQEQFGGLFAVFPFKENTKFEDIKPRFIYTNMELEIK